MTWSNLILSTPTASAVNATHLVKTFEVSPWTFEHNEGVLLNTVLSFPNAINAVISELPVLNSSALLAIAVAGKDAQSFADQCASLAAVFPVRQVLQWQRHAQHLANLEDIKMNLVAQQSVDHSSLLHAIPTVSKLHKKAYEQKSLADAAALTTANPLSNLNLFHGNKNLFDAQVNANDPELSGGDGWRFYSDGNIAADLRVNHPNHAYKLCAVLVFAGTALQLKFLSELLT